MQRLVWWFVVATLAAQTCRSEPAVAADRARTLIESSARAYRSIPALRDQLSYVVDAPGSERETKSEQYEWSADGGVRVRNALLEAVATKNGLTLVQSDVPGRYVFADYSGDFGAVLRRVAGDGSLFEPPPLAMHQGKELAVCIDAMRFNLLAPLRIADCREKVSGDDGRVFDEIRFVADNGEMTLSIDRETHLFASIAFAVKPPGAPEGFQVHVHGTFSPQVVTPSELNIAFTPGSRTAVNNLTELTSKRLPVGSAAPDFVLETIGGEKIDSRQLRGSPVLLDFWATWCVPCWKGLKETQSIADWAVAEKIPLKVFAVSTMEQGTDAESKLRRVRRFWQSQRFTMPTLFDSDSKMFGMYASPGLPSMVLISAEGKILHYHEGLFPDMDETLRKELRETIPGRAQ